MVLHNAVEDLLEAAGELASDVHTIAPAELRVVAADLLTQLKAYTCDENLCLPTEHITKATVSIAKARFTSPIFFSAVVAVLESKESVLSLSSEEMVDLLVAFDYVAEHRLAGEETCAWFMEHVVELWCKIWRN
jgi:hypothetical protein